MQARAPVHDTAAANPLSNGGFGVFWMAHTLDACGAATGRTGRGTESLHGPSPDPGSNLAGPSQDTGPRPADGPGELNTLRPGGVRTAATAATGRAAGSTDAATTHPASTITPGALARQRLQPSQITAIDTNPH